MQHQRGQVLLITVMLLATALTVVLSITFRSTTETQTTKLEEESQKALAAAEAGIEARLKSTTTVDIPSLLNPGSGISAGQAVLDTTTQNKFLTPLISKDEQYTFYLGATYNPLTNTFGDSSNETINICFGTPSSTPYPALELTLIKAGSIKRYTVDPAASLRISNAGDGHDCNFDTSFLREWTIQNTDISTNSKILVVRVLFASTRLLLHRTSVLPLQGRTIISEAKTTTGVMKKVQLFQSYPQIPAEYFVTTF